jgi:hypothetical protein
MNTAEQPKGPFTIPRPGAFKVAHRCNIDRSTNPPTTSGDMLSIEGVPVDPKMIDEAIAVRVNGKWFVADPGAVHLAPTLLEAAWEQNAPPAPS